jgi:hypothetical protein
MDYGYVMTFSTQLHAVPCFVMDTFHLIVTIICLLIIVEEQLRLLWNWSVCSFYQECFSTCCKSNYHTITTMTAQRNIINIIHKLRHYITICLHKHSTKQVSDCCFSYIIIMSSTIYIQWDDDVCFVLDA